MTEATDPVWAHTHDSPMSLALEMDELDEAQLQEIEDRLVSCGTCLESLETLIYWLDALDHWDPRVGPEFVIRHQLMVDLFFDHHLHRDRLEGARSEDRFHSWGLARLLLEESQRASPISPSNAHQLAELTHSIVGLLDQQFYGPRRVEDLRAEAAANLAVLERDRKRPEESKRLFRLAHQSLASGTGRSGITRIVLGRESLFSRSNPREGAMGESSKKTKSPAECAEEPDLPRPVHQLYERCKAARKSQ